jgi:hypothetical protein
MKVTVKKVPSSSTLLRTTIIVNSSILKYSKIFFQNHTKSKPSPHSNGQIIVMWGCHGSLIIGLHGGHKETRFLLKQNMIQ